MIGVLGGTGFLGSHVCAKLSALGIEYVAGSRRGPIWVDARVQYQINDWIKQHKIDSIINLAAECGGIGLNRDRPFDLWLATNKILSSVLEACVLSQDRESPITKLTTVGTVCSYAHSCPTPFKEDDLMHHGMPESTNAAYGVAKLNGLLGSVAIRKQYAIDSIFLLPANMYGPRDHFNDTTSHVIPALIKKCDDAMMAGEKRLYCWGSGTPTREFLYVEDSADAIINAHLGYGGSDPINIGTGVETSIHEVATMITTIMGFEGDLVWDPTKPDGQPKRRLDVTRAERYLDFKAQTTLEEGLKKTIAWYMENKNAN